MVPMPTGSRVKSTHVLLAGIYYLFFYYSVLRLFALALDLD